MNYILPKPLKKGDTIAVIAPAGPISYNAPILRAKKYFENLGYEITFGQHLFDQDRYLAASDEDRLEDLHWAFGNKDIDAIICARGGYGTLRIINDIDYNLIKYNPKNFCGYSDITILSLMMLKKSGLITYSSPMMKGDFGSENKSEYTIQKFFDALEHKPIKISAPKLHKQGKAHGIMWGGNLASIASLCGIDFIPEDDFIFFAEDLNEPVYKIDKMLTQLLNIPQFRKHIKGIVFGKFLDTEYPEQLDYLFDQISNDLNIPTVSDVNISHDDDKITIPIGKMAKLENDTLII